MKKTLILCIVLFSLISCDIVDFYLNPTSSVEISFVHSWNDKPIQLLDVKYTNENGEKMSINKLKYVVSKIILKKHSNQVYTIKDYILIDLNKSRNFINFEEVPAGYYQISFVFGLNNEDNIDDAFQDLNAQNFNCPETYGGGYYYMQLEGEYLNSNDELTNYYYHTIRANDKSNPQNLVFQDTSFKVDLGIIEIGGLWSTQIIVNHDISEWFKNPYSWNLNNHNPGSTGDFDTQILMSENGKSVFSLKKTYID